MIERGFHPFAVLHFLRKTILLYLLPLLQVLFARNWAALRTALVQGAALLTVLAAVSAAVLHAGRWRVDAQGTLRVRWRLGVRLDRCLKASQLAALTIERPLLYRLAGASRVVLYPAGQKRTLTLLLNAQDAQLLADRMMPRRDAVAHTPRGGEKLAFAVLGANGLSTLALLALAIKQSRPYVPDAQTAAFAHLNHIAAWAARWLPMGTAWLLVLGGVLFCASLVRSAAHAAHYTVWRTESHLGSRGGFVRRYEMRLALEHLSYADLRRSPATWALGCCPVFVTAGSCQPEIPLLVWREDGPFLQELLPGFALPPKAPVDTAGRSIPAFFLPAGIPCGLCLLLTAVSRYTLPALTVPLLVVAAVFAALLAGAAVGYRREGIWLQNGRLTLRWQHGFHLHDICVLCPVPALTALQMRETGCVNSTAGPPLRWNSSSTWWATASRSWWSAFRRKMPARRSSWRPHWLNSLPGTTPTRRTRRPPIPASRSCWTSCGHRVFSAQCSPTRPTRSAARSSPTISAQAALPLCAAAGPACPPNRTPPGCMR